MRAAFFVYIFVINVFLKILGDDNYPDYVKAANKSMLPYELQDVFDFENNGDVVIVRGYEHPIPYVIGKDDPILFKICREKPEKCKHNLGEMKEINFCYNSTEVPQRSPFFVPCKDGLFGFLIREDRTMEWDKNNSIFVANSDMYSTDPGSFPGGIPQDKCIDVNVTKKDLKYWFNIGHANFLLNPLPLTEEFSFQGDTNLREIQLSISSTNKVCGFYFKFFTGFFPIYNWVESPAAPTTTSTTTTSTAVPSSLPTTSTTLPTTTQTTNTGQSATTTTTAQPPVAESFLLQWILVGIGLLIIIALLAASIYCCVRHKFEKPRPSKKSLSEKKIPEQQSLPASSEGGPGNQQQQSSEAQTAVIDFRKKLKNPAAKKGSKIKSLQTAVSPPKGLRGLKSADELYRLALTAETHEERNIYLDSAIENANEEIQIWQNSASSQTNDTSMLPTISKRILNAKKAGVKLITTKDPTKLIPEQMDGLTYEQINDLALIEYYPNVRYSLFERAAELVKRTFEDSAPNAHFDKDTFEPLLYQYQIGIHEINEEPHKDVEKRMKLVDEILKKKEMKENNK